MAKEFIPDPKPEPKKKKAKSNQLPSKTILPSTNTANQSKINRNFGKAVEREVAKRTGGERTPGSGAIKTSNRNLTGDVEIRDADNSRDIIKLEVKGSGVITANGELTYVLKRSVLNQMFKEADDAGEVGALWLHFKGQKYEDGFVIMQAEHWERFLAWARLGASIEHRGYRDEES